MLVAFPVHAQLESKATKLRVGNWVEIRGTLGKENLFQAARVDLIEPARYQVLIGTVVSQLDTDHFTLLGQRVEIQEKTEIGKLDLKQLQGTRVKVEGYYRGPRKFSARELDPRGDGRERISGQIDNIRNRRRTVEITVMNTIIEIAADIPVEHELAWNEYSRSETGALAIADFNRDEEDRFGDGYWITDNLQVSGQAGIRGLSENEYNLDERDQEDRDDIESALRARLVYQPFASFFAVGELNYRQLYRNDDDKGRLQIDNTKLGESYLYWIDPFSRGVDIQLGRVDFDEDRNGSMTRIWTRSKQFGPTNGCDWKCLTAKYFPMAVL